MKWILPLLIAALTLASCSQTPQTTYAASEARVQPAGQVNPNGPVFSFADVVARVAPAVVTIRASRRVRNPEQFQFFDDPLFRELFGGRMPQEKGSGTTVEHALGSGVIVREDGYILTNHHVVDGAQDIKVDFSSGRTYPAKLIGSDAPSDLAVLRISAGGLPVLHLGNSDQVQVGDVCLAVGNPLGVGESVTNGIISAKGRETDVSTGSFQDFLQTDAPINQGNSGGALVNTRAQLIGINSEIISQTGGSVGIGFAIPSNMAQNVMNQLIATGKVQRGMIGVGIQTVTSDLAASLGLKQMGGVLINSVNPGGPAAKAGLKTGDVILKLNGTTISDANALRNAIAGTPPGTEVTLTVLRSGNQQNVRVRLGELPTEHAAASTGGNGSGSQKLGLTVAPLTPDLAAQAGVAKGTHGVVVENVDPNGPAAQAGIEAGDVIEQVNQQPVASAADIQRAMARSGNRPPLLLVNRQGETVFVPVPLS